MKKTGLIPILLLTFILNSEAQNIKLLDDQGTDISNTAVTFWGNLDVITLEYHLKVQNTSNNSLDIKVKKEDTNTLRNTENYICWGNCYDPTILETPTSITIAANETNENDFHAAYSHQGITGQSTIKYTFFDANNPDDKVEITVTFNVTTTSTANLKNSALKLWATHQTIHTQIPETVIGATQKIYTLSGQLLQTKKLLNTDNQIFTKVSKTQNLLIVIQQNKKIIHKQLVYLQ